MIDKIILPRQCCPICGDNLPEFARGLTYHARTHQIEPEELFCLIFSCVPRLCECGCNETTRWLGWKQLDYATYKRGHEAKTTSGRMARSSTLKHAYSTGILEHWTARLDDSVVKAKFQLAAKKTSQKLSEGYKSGLYTHWLKKPGVKNSELFKQWKTSIEKSRPRRSDHWKFMSHNVTLERIKSSIGERFSVDDSSLQLVLGSKQNNTTSRLTLTCTRCQTTIDRSIYGIIRGDLMCQSCDRNFSSHAEAEIADYVRSLGFDVRQNDRRVLDGHELDVYVPHKNFGIEYNGLYWHSTFVNQRKNYHDVKRQMCADRGITLFNVFEDEWRNKRDIVMSMISHRLGVSQQKIHARSCKVTTRSREDVAEFLDRNHIDGNVKFIDALCLEFNNEIVAVATFRTPFHKKWKGMLELARFCTKVHTHVPGALSRLTQAAIALSKDRRCSGLLTYVDTRFGSNETCYSKSGWSNVEKTGIRWWWTDKVERYDRFKYRAADGLSEMQVAEINGVAKLFGTVQLRLLITCSTQCP